MQEKSTMQFYQSYNLPPQNNDLLFNAVVIASIGLFLFAGIMLKKVKPLPVVVDAQQIEKIKTQFVIKEAAKKKEQPKIVKSAEEAKKPIDLTKPTELKQKDDDIVKKEQDLPVTTRRVYGLRKVYSIGLGAGGSVSDAVIGKLGNTLNKDIDTIQAKPEDLKGQLVSVTTVTAMPVIKISVKPEYTEEMKKNKVQGVISAKLLVDIDGSVKEVILLNDLGFGSREAALTAFKKLSFTPAMQGSTPVAVWIVLKFKFVLQE